MEEDIVKFLFDSKGFRFITSSESREDIFIHNSGLIDSINKGNKVKYVLERVKKGMNAVNVEVIR
ncbi:cold-shock protein [Tenacibaculum aiptasiae]|uniref:cold-shock protein n=1 Tax=Tenacibaculum aiptasiae TaxID=426481 RepID=UPI00232FF467|nr:cold shock domain-containing protein [Tenacibaculum aiptasiae]